jgi:RecJ-like exonuclease
MGTCIICGTDADGDICATHEEDVFFDFRGDRPDQLTPNRYYRGSVDGFAEFGVFVDVGEVTGLLHRSEIPKRLESLDWDPGEEVFVQVLSIHDNGNVDLGWSLRQADREFRGQLIDDPEIGRPVLPETLEESGGDEEPVADTAPETAEGSPDEEGAGVSDPSPVERSAETESSTSGTSEPSGQTAEAGREPEAGSGSESTDAQTESGRGAQGAAGGAATATAPPESAGAAEVEPPERIAVESLADDVGEIVAIEGEITDVRQTSGPTVFQVADETASVECAAFVEAGVRAYPEVEVGDVVRLVGEVERRRGDLQIETTSLDVLSGDEAEAVQTRLEDAMAERATPTTTDPFVEDPSIEVVQDAIEAAATTIRRAVIDARPVIIRHTATLEGYVAGTAIERALLPLVEAEHAAADAVYHYVDRRPLEDEVYDVSAATSDVTSMLEAADRHGEKHPLFVLVDAGSTRESTDGLEFLSIYDAQSVVVDGGFADADAADAAEVLVSPTAAGAKPVSTGTLGVHLAAMVNESVREDLRHLPASSYWEDVPEVYREMAAEAGYDADSLADIRNAVALEAFYQSYEDKRELIADLFWDERNRSLAAPISDQFEAKLETEIETARPHLERREAAGVTINVLDVEAYTHQYDFPPIGLLIDAIHRREVDSSEGTTVTIGLERDELRLESSAAVDVRAIGEAVAEDVPGAGVTPRGGRDGRIEFLAGERDAVLEAVSDEVTTWLG